jgi:kinesin family protein C2/C3
MFVHISPESDALGESISTLKFAERVSTVELGAARLNKESGEVKELKEQVCFCYYALYHIFSLHLLFKVCIYSISIQIARLKSSLAMKDSGSEQNINRDPEAFNMKMPSPGFSNRRQGSCELVSSQTNFRQPMEDVGNIEVRANPTLRQKKPSFDLQDLLASNDSPSWPDSISRANFQMGEERVTIGGEWIDKVVVNNNNSVGDWEGDSAALPDFFYQRYHSGTRDKQYLRNNSRKKDGNEFEQQRPRFYSTNTDDSDDIDIATSDSSESDALWQFNVQSINSSISENGSKIKKPQTKLRESSDTRTPLHSQIPSASRKTSNGNRSGRQPLSGSDSRRLSSNGRHAGTK